MRQFILLSWLVLVAVVVGPALADVEPEDLGKDWLADARKEKNEGLEAALTKGIELLRQHADQVNANSKIRVYDVVLKARPGREGWDIYTNVDGKQACKLSLKRDHGKPIELDALSGCAKDCAHHQRVACQTI